MAYKIIFDLFTYSVIYFSVNFIVYKNEALIKSNPFFLIIVLLAIFIGSLQPINILWQIIISFMNMPRKCLLL